MGPGSGRYAPRSPSRSGGRPDGPAAPPGRPDPADPSRRRPPRGGRLTGGQVLYVEGKSGRYLVDAAGTKYLVRGTENDADLLTRALVGDRTEPQPVTEDWLATLHEGSPIDFPVLQGQVGAAAGVGGGLTAEQDKVGMVLQAQTGAGPRHYVVLEGKVQPVSDFTAWLLINSPQTDELDMGDAFVDRHRYTQRIVRCA